MLDYFVRRQNAKATAILMLLTANMYLFRSIGQRNEIMGHVRIVGGNCEEHAYVTTCGRRIAKSSYPREALATADEQH